jgi:hypothetical protein
MKLIIIILTAFIFILFTSCEKTTYKKYYDSGELLIEMKKMPKVSDHFYVREYFRNGNVRQEGVLKGDSIPNGYWKIYYGDGKLRWQGEIIQGVIQHQEYSQNWTWPDRYGFCKDIEFEGNPEKLYAGNHYNFRVIMPDIHPKLYAIFDKDYNPIRLRENDNEIFPYTFISNQSGSYYILFVFMNKDGGFLVGNPTSYVELRIEGE